MMLTVTRMRRKVASTSPSTGQLAMLLRDAGWSPLSATLAHRGAELALGQPAPAPLVPELTRAPFHDDFIFLPSSVLYFVLDRGNGNPPSVEAGALHELGTQPPAELARLTASLDAALPRAAGESAKAASNGATWTQLPWRPVSAPFVLLKERI